MNSTAAHRPERGAFLGQPLGLTVVILTGMWEVFALSGMRTVLVFYLVHDLKFSDASAVALYSFSTAAAFAMPLLGGLVADNFLGVRRAVVIGALVMAAGHLLLVAPAALYPALVLITLGNGLFKPSLVSQIGPLYDLDDARRDRAFVFYKAGCNSGAILSPIACGLVGAAFGWRYALGLCGVAMSVAAVIFLVGQRFIVVRPPAPEAADPASPVRSRPTAAVLLPLALVMVGAVLFWAAHGQQGGTIALWAERSVDRSLHLGTWSFVVPAGWFQSVNPIVIVLLTPVLTWLWSRQDARANGRGELRKMATGGLILAACFLIVAAAAGVAGGRLVSPVWPVLALVVLATGELYFDAIGQAFMVRLAPPRAITTFVSFWFLVQAAGFFAAGWLGLAWAWLTPAAYFASVAVVAVCAAVVVSLAAVVRRRTGAAA